MVKKLSDFVNTALNKCSISLGDETDQPTCKIKHWQSWMRSRTCLKMTKIYLKVFNISLKLFKALLVNRLQVQGGANMTKHQFGGHCNPPFPGKCRSRSIPSPLTRRTAAGDHYYKLVELCFIAKRNITNYSKAFPCVNQL